MLFFGSHSPAPTSQSLSDLYCLFGSDVNGKKALCQNVIPRGKTPAAQRFTKPNPAMTGFLNDTP